MNIVIATIHVRESAQAVPLAAGCLKSSLPDHFKKNTLLVDLLPDQSDNTVLSKLLQSRPDIIAFSLYTWNRQQALKICQQIKQQSPDIYIVAGGPEASADSTKILNEGCLDAVIRGEGEHSFSELITRLSEQKPLSGISGLALADEATLRPNSAVCPDLNTLTSPWLTEAIQLEEGCGVLWEVARGCHFNCAFCYDAKGHQGVRPLPLERLRQELELFVTKGVSQVWVLDSTFNAPSSRGQQLLQMLQKTAPQLHYHIEAKADLLDDVTIGLLSELFCSVQVGLQSANPEILAPLQRQLKPQQMSQQLHKLSAAGITFGLDLIYGLPGDNHDGFKTSLDFTLKQQPNQIDIFPLAVLPGTELFDKKEQFGIDGQPQPPYMITHNATYSANDMKKSRLLAAATDIFYNRGRAVGFFLQLCQAVESTPVAFLDAFACWMLQSKAISHQSILDIDHWTTDLILPLQLEFIQTELKKKKRKKLIPAAEDLIRYHYCCAEIVLAENCLPQPEMSIKQILKSDWYLNPNLKIESFHYPLDGLEMFGGEKLKTIGDQLTQDPAHSIFLRQEGEMISETLDDDFAAMLLKARKGASGAQLIFGIDRQSGQELLTFAVAQGLILPS
jgi:radical SAM superfamily enzyme YgiQ (UPF0313 family)